MLRGLCLRGILQLVQRAESSCLSPACRVLSASQQTQRLRVPADQRRWFAEQSCSTWACESERGDSTLSWTATCRMFDVLLTPNIATGSLFEVLAQTTRLAEEHQVCCMPFEEAAVSHALRFCQAFGN